MKIYFMLLSVFLLLISCKKETNNSAPVTNKSPLDNYTPYPPPPGGGITVLTNEELENMGKNTGCNLAQLRRVDVYNNTISSTNFPEIYKDGVRFGWTNCYSLGTPAGNSGGTNNTPNCRLVTFVLTSGGTYLTSYSQTVCSGSGVGGGSGPRIGIP